MARFEMTIERDSGDLHLSYGYDRLMGFFVTVKCGDLQKAEYDALNDDYDGLRGLLGVLVETGAYRQEEVEEALTCLMTSDSADIEDRAVRQVAVIIENVKRAAGE